MRALLRRVSGWMRGCVSVPCLCGGGGMPAYVRKPDSVVVLIGEHGPETLSFPPTQARP